MVRALGCRLEEELDRRNQGRRMRKGYVARVRRFASLCGSTPEAWDGRCVRGFLTDLVTRQGVSASMQNQALANQPD